MPFELAEHTGDLAVRLRAPDLAGLIAEGVRALASLLFEGERRADAREEGATLTAEGIDREDLLVQALSEALHLLQEESFFPLDVRVRAPDERRAELELRGVRADGRTLRRSEEIKAVTYHAVAIEQREGELETLVIFDV